MVLGNVVSTHDRLIEYSRYIRYYVGGGGVCGHSNKVNEALVCSTNVFGVVDNNYYLLS